jgi:hypothetical protein
MRPLGKHLSLLSASVLSNGDSKKKTRHSPSSPTHRGEGQDT